MTVYLCGPMTGYQDFNFPAFDAAEARLKRLCFKVISPANLDREANFNPTNGCTLDELHACIKRDVEAIFASDLVITLEGCENSVGATAELALARWMKKPIRPYSQYQEL